MTTPIKTKLSQKHLSTALGISQPTISNWLNLKSKPTGLARAALQERFPELLQRIDAAWEKK